MRPSSYNTTRSTRNTADPYFTMTELSPINTSLPTLEASGRPLYLAFILIIEQQGEDWQIKCMHNKEYLNMTYYKKKYSTCMCRTYMYSAVAGSG